MNTHNIVCVPVPVRACVFIHGMRNASISVVTDIICIHLPYHTGPTFTTNEAVNNF